MTTSSEHKILREKDKFDKLLVDLEYAIECDIGCSERHIDFLDAQIQALLEEGYDVYWENERLLDEKELLRQLKEKLALEIKINTIRTEMGVL